MTAPLYDPKPRGAIVREEHEVLTMRGTSRFEMRHLLTIGGFAVLHEYGDYAGAPPTYGADQISVARRPLEAE